MDVIQFTKSSAVIQFAALNEKPANRVKRRLPFLQTKLVERFHHRAIQIPRPQIRATVLRHFYACRIAESLVFIMRRLDLLKRFRVGKIKAVAQINHRAQHGGTLNFAATRLLSATAQLFARA